MSLLIGLVGCTAYERNGWNEAVRSTGFSAAQRLGVDSKVFVGDMVRTGPYTFSKEPQGPPTMVPVRPFDIKKDTIVLPCDDSYTGLMWKVREMFKWALERDYEYIWHHYHDTYYSVERLVTSGFENFDVAGLWAKGNPSSVFGGPGIFVSRKAAQMYVDDIQEAVLGFQQSYDGCPQYLRNYVHDSDFHASILTDLWLGMLARSKGMRIGTSDTIVHSLDRNEQGPRMSNRIMSCHLSTVRGNSDIDTAEQRYSPEIMLRMHRENDAKGYDSGVFVPFKD